MDRKSFLKLTTALGATVTLLTKTTASAAQMRWLKDEKAKKRRENMVESFAPAFKLYPINKEVTVELSIPKKYAKVADKLKIICSGDDGAFNMQGKLHAFSRKTRNFLPFEVKGDKILIKALFPREQRYTFFIFDTTNIKPEDIEKTLGPVKCNAMARVYALENDLFNATAYKCDFHQHSTYSDGKEEPVVVGVRNLQHGMDYASLSDHHTREGSEKMVEAFKEFPSSLKTYYAEEIHLAEPHILCVGGKAGITKMMKASKKEFNALAEKFLKESPSHLNEFEKIHLARAKTELVFARKLGAHPVLAHPYWRWKSICLSDALIDELVKCDFSAVEVVNSGCAEETNDLAMSLLADCRGNGKDLSMIGVSDSHNKYGHGFGYTISFAKSDSFEDIWGAIMEKKNVAIVADSKDNPIIYGKRRFIKFAYFLLETYFPIHDELCKKEGDIIEKIVTNGKSDELIKQVEDYAKQVNSLYESMKYKV